MTRIAHLTSAHGPFDIRIFMKECRSLAASGYEVILIAPHYRDECVDGVRILGVPKPTRGRLQRATFTSRAILQAALRTRADLYHFHDPELIVTGLILKLRGKRVIYDAHENVPADILSKEHLPRIARRSISASVGAFERAAARIFDGVIGVNQDIVRRFPPDKTIRIANYAMVEEFETTEMNPPADRRPVMAHIGAITKIRGISQVVQALSKLPDGSPVRAAFAGEFAPASYEEEVRSSPGAARLDILGLLTRPVVRDLLATSRAGLLTLLPHANHTEASPNKLFEYMAAGLPVIASDLPGIRRIVEESNCGLLIDPTDVGALARAMEFMAGNPGEAETMGRRGRLAILERYNWGAEAAKLAGFYRSLLGN